MLLLVPIVLLAASTNLQLVDEVYRIPANDWRWVPVSLRQKPALISARYQANGDGTEVRLKLVRRADLERGRDARYLAATGFGRTGHLLYQVMAPDDYVVLVENDAEAPAEVLLRISLDFTHAGPRVTRLSPQRQFTVIAISFAVFFGIVTWSARKLLKAVRKS
jgi:hypothetical protein